MRLERPFSLTRWASDTWLADGPIVVENGSVSLGWERIYRFDPTFSVSIRDVEAFAFDPLCDLLYVLDGEGVLHRYDIHAKRWERGVFTFDVAGKERVEIALARDRFFLLDGETLQARSLSTWQSIWTLPAQRMVSFCVDENGIVYGIVKEEREIVRFGPGGRRLESLRIPGVESPISLAVEERTLYVLERDRLVAWNLDEAVATGVETAISSPLRAVAVDSHGRLYVGVSEASEEGTVWRSDEEGKIGVPLSCCTEAVRKIAFDGNDSLFVLDTSGHLASWRAGRSYGPNARLVYLFDSTFHGCRWHRMEAVCTLPEGKGAMVVEAGAFDRPPEGTDIDTLPPLPLRAENLKNLYLFDGEETEGRYLVVKVTLFTDPTAKISPRFEKLEVRFPKMTYVEYLPALYREDEESEALLERFLSIFQEIVESVERKIEKTHLLVDPRTTESEFLEWLSLWLGLEREKFWPEERWRVFLTEAMRFFRMRGTVGGLKEVIALFLGEEDEKRPLIVEPLHGRCGGGTGTYGLDPFTFCVIFRPRAIGTERELEGVKRIVELWKPAHTEGRVVVLKERMVLGTLLYLGINSSLGSGLPVIGEAALSIDSELGEEEIGAHLQIHGRVGMDVWIS